MQTQSMWNRLDELSELGLSSFEANGTRAQLAVVIDGSLPKAGDLIPAGYRESEAAWLPWDMRARLLLRSERAQAGAEHRLEAAPGREIIGTTLRVGDLHLGVLAGEIPAGGALPWSPVTAARIANGLARSLAPRLSAAWSEALSAQQRTSMLQLALERLGGGSEDVALLRGEEDGASPHFRGEVRQAGASVSYSYFGRVEGGPCPPSLATLVAASVRRYLGELPDPDPSTVIDAVHADVAELLEHVGARCDLTVVVPTSGELVAVSSTSAAVVALGRDGRVRDGVSSTGPTLEGAMLKGRATETVPLPGGGYLVATDAVTNLSELVGYSAHVACETQRPVDIAVSLREAMVAARRRQPSTVLAHAIG